LSYYFRRQNGLFNLYPKPIVENLSRGEINPLPNRKRNARLRKSTEWLHKRRRHPSFMIDQTFFSPMTPTMIIRMKMIDMQSSESPYQINYLLVESKSDATILPFGVLSLLDYFITLFSEEFSDATSVFF